MIKEIAVAQAIFNKIQTAQHILVITHQNPDGDGLGALSALAQYLQSINKDYQLFCRDLAPPNYQFLPRLHQLISDPLIFSKQTFDLIIVLDTSSLDYAGIEEMLRPLPKAPARQYTGTGGGDQPLAEVSYPYTLVNIDHHLTNNNFGQLNLVQNTASSASEIIYDLLRLWQVAITKEIATALLNGIIFDTGAFSNAATSLYSLQVASHLLNLGARHKEINENILRNKSLSLLKLWGIAFERLVYNEKYQVAFTVLTLDDFRIYNVEPEAAAGLSNFFNELAGAKVILVLTEPEEGLIKGSLRTTTDEVDVGKLVQKWGGGGHKKAAGFSLKGKLVYNEGRWQIR